QTYNIVHISMMCVLPLVFEFILYMLILAFLSDAEKGEFSGFRRFASRSVEANGNASNTSYHKVTLSRRLSRSANSSPPDSFAIKNHGFKDGESRRSTTAINAQGVSSLADDKQQLLMIRNELRRASHPRHQKDLNENHVPWKRTVNIVRRNARRKVRNIHPGRTNGRSTLGLSSICTLSRRLERPESMQIGEGQTIALSQLSCSPSISSSGFPTASMQFFRHSLN
ncbi:hypothetical protein PMAYCL1PPCAC_32284, partial [Pristionchus mayeri]